ncbi:TRAP transporter small permease subunit [Mangrovicoccus sp. HB161399]|uniref:TRAP transporter small permease subunit n=1 Tax=Mangrovicoccus sp. HB161399 TaxID=2720392 RepID=UPI00155425C0|nr:TRAP transporter small permease [Mangrovicoccus sp. HB161399]
MRKGAQALAQGLDRILAVLRAVSAAGIWIGGGILVALAFGVGAEVLLRKLAGTSIGGLDELGGYALAIVAALAFTEALFTRSHIRIGLLRDALGPRLRGAMDIVSLAGLIWFLSILLWFGWKLVLRSATMGTKSMTPLATPLILPQALWYTALLLFGLAALALLLRALAAAALGDWDGIAARVGLRDAEEELRDEQILSAEAAGTGREVRT